MTRPRLLDSSGRPFTRPSRGISETVGVMGTPVYGGYIADRETDPKLTRGQKYLTYSEILHDASIVAAGVRFFLNLVSRADCTFEAEQDHPNGIETAEACEKAIKESAGVPFRQVVRRAATYVFYGFSCSEWKMGVDPRSGTRVFTGIKTRAQRTIERWDVDADGTVFGVFQTSPQDGSEIYIPRNRMMYLVDGALNDSPEGLGLFRHFVKPAEDLAELRKLERWGYQTELGGVPIGRAPLSELDGQVDDGDMTAADKDQALEGMRQFLRDPVRDPKKALILDSKPYNNVGDDQAFTSIYEWGLDLLKSQSTSSSAAIHAAIERVTRELARIMGVEQLLLGGDGAGSFALSEQKAIQFYLIVESALADLAEAMNRDLLIPLARFNGWDIEALPKLKFETPSFNTVAEISEVVKNLAAAGAPIMPNDEVVRELYGRIGLPFTERRLDEDDADASLIGHNGGPSMDKDPPAPGTEGDE